MRMLLVAGDSWRSQIVKKLTMSRWSHCAILLPNGMVIEADMSGVTCRPYWEYHWSHQVIEYPCLPAQVQQAAMWARQQIGLRYDLAHVIGVGVYLLIGWDGLARAFDRPLALYCADLNSQYLQRGGIQPPVPAHRSLPESFAQDRRAFPVSRDTIAREISHLDFSHTQEVD